MESVPSLASRFRFLENKLEIQNTENKRTVRVSFVLGAIAACIAILIGLHMFSDEREIKVVQSTYENGMNKEVWVYTNSLFGKRKKIMETTYYQDGSKESERSYEKGKVNGWARMWYKSGRLHVEGTYKDDKPHGIRTSYHENGRPFCRARYEHGKLMEKENWDEDGNEIFLPIDRE